ncbi:MAG TPA: hypothetical protein VK486_11615 [Thermoleophilaceae bacterium]|nr:hypothetical protein [Thermoleophilaceae bacterium]
MNSIHVEHDALAALRLELVSAAGRRSAKRRKTRRKVIVVAVAALLLAATAATAALTHFSTGVGAVDRLLEIDVPASRRPGPGSASEPLHVRIGDGNYQTVAYLARDGSVCIASAERHRGSVRGSFGGCPSLEDVNRRVQRRGAVWYGGSAGPDQRTYQLIVGGEVTSVRPLGDGDWNVLITRPWTPHARGARALKLVVVIDDRNIDVGGDGVQQDEMHLLEVPLPRLKLTYANGSSRIARAP